MIFYKLFNGLASPRGCESILHTASSWGFELRNSDEYILLQIDLKNPFNNISRQATMRETRRNLPEAYKLIKYAYGSALGPSLMYQRKVVPNTRAYNKGIRWGQCNLPPSSNLFFGGSMTYLVATDYEIETAVDPRILRRYHNNSTTWKPTISTGIPWSRRKTKLRNNFLPG